MLKKENCLGYLRIKVTLFLSSWDKNFFITITLINVVSDLKNYVPDRLFIAKGEF